MKEPKPDIEKPQSSELTFSASLFSAFLCVIFGANAVAIKFSLAGLGPFTAAGLRFCMASVVIFLWAKITGRRFHLRKEQLSQMLIITVFFTSQLSLFYLGISRTHASRATLIVNLLPFFVLILAHFFLKGDRITIRKLLGMLLGFSGMALIFFEKEGVNSDLQSGDIMVLIAALIWSSNTIYIKRIIHKFEAFHIVWYPMIFSIPLFLAEALLFDRPMIRNVDTTVIWAMAYQGLITASFGFVGWNSMLQKYGASALHSFVFIVPITGVLMGGTILGERISVNILFALIMVASGIIVVHLKTNLPGVRFFFGRNI